MVQTTALQVEASFGKRTLLSRTFEFSLPVCLFSDVPGFAQSAAGAVFTEGVQSAGPSAKAEISGFWTTALEELFLGYPPREFAPHGLELIKVLGMVELLARDPQTLSGGEAARLIIASHLLGTPLVLLVDGLFDEIDIGTRRSFLKYLAAGHLETLIVNVNASVVLTPCAQWNLDIDSVQMIDGSASNVDKWWRDSLTVETLRGGTSVLACSGLNVFNLSCVRGKRAILSDLSFSVASGAIALLLGPNGSGKTTLFECLAGLLDCSGDIAVNGDRVNLTKKTVIAYSPQDPDEDVVERTLYDEISLASSDVEVAELLARCKVPSSLWHTLVADEPGLKKVASVIAAVGRDKPLLLLDEPSLLCDSDQKTWVAAAVAEQSGRGGVTLLSSHDSEFLDMLASSPEGLNVPGAH